MAVAYRIKFSRKGPASYMGHLDMLRYIQKAISRSGIDIRYSSGFNPHQILSFAYPLGVSMETEGDYFDIELNSEMATDLIFSLLNRVLTEGIEVLLVTKLPEKALNAMASVALADYRVYLSNADEEFYGILEQINTDSHLYIEKECRKDGQTFTDNIDIKPGIFELKREKDSIFMKLMSGSSLNIKPVQIIDYINLKFSKNASIEKIVRLELYREKEPDLYVPLGDFND